MDEETSMSVTVLACYAFPTGLVIVYSVDGSPFESPLVPWREL